MQSLKISLGVRVRVRVRVTVLFAAAFVIRHSQFFLGSKSGEVEETDPVRAKSLRISLLVLRALK